MSRIGKQPIPIPTGCTVTLTGQRVRIAGPKGTLEQDVRPEITVRQEGEALIVMAKDPANAHHRAFWGLTRALLRNMVEGVTNGFTKRLEIQGIGYRVQTQGKILTLAVGFSHPVTYAVPDGVTVTAEKNAIVVQGADKQQVGEVAAEIRAVRPPEPYKGKGIRYADEVVRRKVGKVVKAVGAT